MKASEKTLPTLLEPAVPDTRDPAYGLGAKIGTNQPDLRKNPGLWPMFLVYGPGLIRRTLGLAHQSEQIADLGCGCGWLTLEMARANRQAVVHGVDKNEKLIRWADTYYQRFAGSGSLGEVAYTASDISLFELTPGRYDLIVVSFLMGCLENPGELLSRVHRALKPGGTLVYYDACDPPAITLDRLARLRHTLARARGKMSDPWSERRRLQAGFAKDAVRRLRPEKAPPEQHLFHRIEEMFEVTYEARTRAFIDLSLPHIPPRRVMIYVPFYKLVDELCMAIGYLEGSCRYVVARKR
ncbi:MAG: class I SAM-dependent methyltransferase [Candidatus Eremiobacteraeota bacterium]|nr:class I SAM-dependent methyltransferase [Candidatus Eremiobacteraeota bacterium]